MGEVQLNGHQWATGALAQLIAYGDYNGFTKDNNARDDLIKNISKDDCFNLMKETLGIKDQQLTGEDIKNISEQYVNMTLKNNYILQ